MGTEPDGNIHPQYHLLSTTAAWSDHPAAALVVLEPYS